MAISYSSTEKEAVEQTVSTNSSMKANKSGKFSNLLHLAIVVFFACLVNYPCLLWGLRFGHDHNLHIIYFHLFDQQLRAGELYPRWIQGLNFGAGSPIFFIQYPLPFYAAAGLQRALQIPLTAAGEAHALGLFVFLAGILFGVFCWLWCREFTNSIAALCASLICVTMPFPFGCDIYYRAAIGEYSALAWTPLALFFAHQIDQRPMRAVAGTALVFGAIVLSNPFTAILLAPFLLLYAVCRAAPGRMLPTALFLGTALLLGLGVAGVYVWPMNVHRGFFSSANLNKLGPGTFFYLDHLFPFGEGLFPVARLRLRILDFISAGLALAIVVTFVVRLRHEMRSRLAQVLGWAAIACVLFTCVAPLLKLAGIVLHPDAANARVIDARVRIFLITFLTLEVALLAYVSLPDWSPRLPRFLLTSSLACYFLMTYWSASIWRHVSVLQNIQFPWRLAGHLSIFAAGLCALAFKNLFELPRHSRRPLSVAWAALYLLVGISSWVVLDISQEFKPSAADGSLKVGTAYLAATHIETAYPTYAKVLSLPSPDELGPNDRFVTGALLVAGDGTAELDSLSPRHRQLKADCLTDCTLVLKLVYYPFWQAHEGLRNSIALRPSTGAGLTELSLGPGMHNVDLELPIGRAETGGLWLSLTSLVAVVCLFLIGGPGKGWCKGCLRFLNRCC